MHYIGRKVWVEKIAFGTGETASLACDPQYNNENQELLAIAQPYSVTNRDRLIVHCVFDSSNRTTLTKGGEEVNHRCLFTAQYSELTSLAFTRLRMKCALSSSFTSLTK